jgi:hypothetical protein
VALDEPEAVNGAVLATAGVGTDDDTDVEPVRVPCGTTAWVHDAVWTPVGVDDTVVAEPVAHAVRTDPIRWVPANVWAPEPPEPPEAPEAPEGVAAWAGAAGVVGVRVTPTVPRMPCAARPAGPGNWVAAASPVVATIIVATVVTANTAGVRRSRRLGVGHDDAANRKAARASSSPTISWV